MIKSIDLYRIQDYLEVSQRTHQVDEILLRVGNIFSVWGLGLLNTC